MKKTLLLTTLLALGACTSTSGGTAPTNPVQNILSGIVKFTQDDIVAADKIAALQNPPDTQGPMCFNWIGANVVTLQSELGGAAPQALVAPAGVLSTLESGNVALNNAAQAIQVGQSLLDAQTRTAFETNCGPWVMHLLGNVAVPAGAGLGLARVAPLLGAL